MGEVGIEIEIGIGIEVGNEVGTGIVMDERGEGRTL